MLWHKKQLRIIHQGKTFNKSPELIYSELVDFSLRTKRVIPTRTEFDCEFNRKTDDRDFEEYLSLSELSSALNTSLSTLNRWLQEYQKLLSPVVIQDEPAIKTSRLKLFFRRYPGEVASYCKPDLLWLISIIS